MAVMMAQAGRLGILSLLPRFPIRCFFGGIPIGKAEAVLPKPGTPPIPYNKGKFWLANTDQGAVALYQVCTHLGCRYRWAEATKRFECPCHGSRFALDGTYLAGPASRSLDRFPIMAFDEHGNRVAQTDGAGSPMIIPPNTTLNVDIYWRISLPPKS